jgi:hypothetical protein
VSIDVNRSHDCPCQTVSVKFDDGLSQKTRGRDSRYDLAGGAAPDLPPLKWSSLKYDLRTEDRVNGEEEAYG